MPDQSTGAKVRLAVEDLEVTYAGRRGHSFTAVDGVSFELAANETLGLVGESGSGKTSIARAIQGLMAASAGTIRLDGEPVRAQHAKQRRKLAAKVQTVFQDPFGSLNPARSVGASIAEPLIVQEPRLGRRVVAERVKQQLDHVGLSTGVVARRPSEFSGGQRQRIAIARALITRPQLVICDEAVSALDLSVQAQILNLLSDLQAELGISYLFITHDLAVVRHIAHRVAVLQKGHLVDVLERDDSDRDAWSPYTRRLFDAAPKPDPVRQRAEREQLRSGAAPPSAAPVQKAEVPQTVPVDDSHGRA